MTALHYIALGLGLFGMGFGAGILFAQWCRMRDKAQAEQREAYWRRQRGQSYGHGWLDDH